MEISEYISIEELNRIYEQLEELPDYLLDDLDSFISCYGCLLYTSRCVQETDDYEFTADNEKMTVEIAFTFDDSSLGGKRYKP